MNFGLWKEFFLAEFFFWFSFFSLCKYYLCERAGFRLPDKLKVFARIVKCPYTRCAYRKHSFDEHDNPKSRQVRTGDGKRGGKLDAYGSWPKGNNSC